MSSFFDRHKSQKLTFIYENTMAIDHLRYHSLKGIFGLVFGDFDMDNFTLTIRKKNVVRLP